MKTTTLLIACLALGSVAAAADNSHLVRLYEEEVLAHDLYVALGKKHPDIRPLQNIPHSEARHREVMADILKAEGINIPKPPEGRRFTTRGLDRTYRQWLKEGRRSEVDACRVGVRLEDHDIADLRAAQKDFPQHKEALANLEAASNNHLRAFHRNLTGRGGKYEAEALPAADFKAIVDGEMQRGACGGDCGKCGPDNNRADRGKWGRGPGAGKGPGGPRSCKGQGQGNGRGRQGGGGPNR
ncbi:DUF2202 domain-containing protein [Haloferula sp. A504]|uniref:DUF2202 domain-containing protein n=1 Tax=Haloferula sp. A504 TaxID=3373601 RepID=UPI0031C0642A|nr:DUF2202 domain-containing protein [Verrucomicrobiaceae bacterium E54]